MRESAPRTSPRQSIGFILVTLVLDAVGFGLILPVMPDLIRDVHGGDLANAALWGGLLATTYAVMQFLFGPLLGNLSDRFGRRPVLLVSLAGMALGHLAAALAGSIWVLLGARFLTGAMAATNATAGAFIADISAPEQKAARFGLIGAAFGVGFVLGPALGGLLGELGPRAPFWAAAVLAGLNLAFGAVVLPETLPPESRRRFAWARANPLGALADIAPRPEIWPLVLMLFFYEFAFTAYSAVWAFFTQARFGWTAAQVGGSLAAFGVGMVVVQGALIRPVLARLGERRTALWALAFNGAAFVVLAFISNGMAMAVLTPFLALGAMVSPAVMGLISRHTGATMQGAMQGAAASARGLAMVLGPVTMTAIFAAFSHSGAALLLPGAPFLLSAAIMALCAALLLRRALALA